MASAGIGSTASLVRAGLSLGSGALVVRPKRGIFPNASAGPVKPIVAQATIEEHHRDQLVVTEHPVEVGAAIADHAYKRPAEVVILFAWSNSPSGPGSLISQAVGVAAAVFGAPVGAIASIPSTIGAAQSILSGNAQDQMKQIYQDLLSLQQLRVPFDVLTGKRAYKNMLLTEIVVETDRDKENILWVRAHCREVLIARTQTVTISSDPAQMEFPDQTQPTRDLGAVQLGEAPTFTPTDITLNGALNSLSGSLQNTQVLTDGISAIQSGPLGELGASLAKAQDSVLEAVSQFSPPLEIPSLPNLPQEFSINLGSGVDLTGAQEEAIAGARSALEETRGIVNGAERQLGVTPDLPAELPGSLVDLKSKIGVALDQFKRISP